MEETIIGERVLKEKRLMEPPKVAIMEINNVEGGEVDETDQQEAEAMELDETGAEADGQHNISINCLYINLILTFAIT
eukprot:m.338592 g.338592  ORF g.338592 m.338592 type:complete len:78 (+) comp18470_c0_seq1:1268-1501(+)